MTLCIFSKPTVIIHQTLTAGYTVIKQQGLDKGTRSVCYKLSKQTINMTNKKSQKWLERYMDNISASWSVGCHTHTWSSGVIHEVYLVAMHFMILSHTDNDNTNLSKLVTCAIANIT